MAQIWPIHGPSKVSYFIMADVLGR